MVNDFKSTLNKKLLLMSLEKRKIVKKTGKIDLDIHKKLRKFIIQKSQRKEDRVKLLLYATSYYMQTLTQGSCDI